MADTKPVLVLGGTGKTGRRVAARLAAQGIPTRIGSRSEFLDGRNARLTDGVQRALGRQPRDFADYARDAAASGVWNAA